MMRFIRRLRQQLVSENLPPDKGGHYSKYALYAIGEILLIVIGIMIALKINNQNIENTQRNEEKQYIQMLLNDLNSDIQSTKEVLETNEKIVTGLEKLINQLEAKPKNKDEQLAVLINSIRYTYTFMTVEYSEIFITQLNANNGFQVIENEAVKKAIIEYYQNLKAINQIQYIDTKQYFHICEASQKALLRLSLATPFYQQINLDFENLFLPITEIKAMIKKGDYLLQDEEVALEKYYNDVLFYKAAVGATIAAFANQKEQAESLMELVKENY